VTGVQTCALPIYSFLSLTGLSALFARYGWMVAAIKLCGGLYLIYLGVMLARSGGATQAATPDAKRRSAYMTGVLTCLTNPKAIAFFASIFALGLKPDTNMATKIALAAIPPVATALWFTLVATCLAQPQIRARYLKRQGLLNRGIGAVLAVFGAKLALGARG
jgi:threonine/homoserine/homoserine lactone efflux protein